MQCKGLKRTSLLIRPTNFCAPRSGNEFAQCSLFPGFCWHCYRHK
uniref:Uncharacterized protein n=1 Tax=Rhizophora mucronata TaxID=61149 RepID=A0A2P2Q5R5_RHIMU